MKNYVTRLCSQCGVEFTRYAPPSVDPKFCSRACSDLTRNRANGARKALQATRPPQEASGYRRVWDEDRHTYVYEHRLVMERHLGRRLTAKEIVHHINENKLDNRLANLQVMTRTEHRRHHGSPSVPKPHLRKPPVPCAWCGTPFRPSAKRVRCCSQSCGQQSRQARERSVA